MPKHLPRAAAFRAVASPYAGIVAGQLSAVLFVPQGMSARDVTEQMQRRYSHVSLDGSEPQVGSKNEGRLAQSRRRPERRERDKGFEPSTFSLGITDDTE